MAPKYKVVKYYDKLLIKDTFILSADILHADILFLTIWLGSTKTLFSGLYYLKPINCWRKVILGWYLGPLSRTRYAWKVISFSGKYFRSSDDDKTRECRRQLLPINDFTGGVKYWTGSLYYCYHFSLIKLSGGRFFWSPTGSKESTAIN